MYSICWFTAQGQDWLALEQAKIRSQELHLLLPYRKQGPKGSDNIPFFCLLAESRIGNGASGIQIGSTWDVGILGGS